MIPALERHCGSWIVIRRSDGESVCEIFSRQIVEHINQERYCVLTALQWLCAFNRAVAINAARAANKGV